LIHINYNFVISETNVIYKLKYFNLSSFESTKVHLFFSQFF